MKLTQKQRRIIALILAFILIATGVVQIVFNIQFNEKITRFMETIILFAGFYLLVISPTKERGKDNKEKDNQEDNTQEDNTQEDNTQEDNTQEDNTQENDDQGKDNQENDEK